MIETRGFALLFLLLSGVAALPRQAPGAEPRSPLFEARPCRDVVAALAPEGVTVRVEDVLRENKSHVRGSGTELGARPERVGAGARRGVGHPG
jgi:hypothetical protein